MTPTTTHRKHFLADLARALPETRQSVESLTADIRSGDPRAVARGMARVERALRLEERAAGCEWTRAIPKAVRTEINRLIRQIGIAAQRGDGHRERTHVKLLGEDDASIGAATTPAERLIETLFSGLEWHSAWSRLGVVPTFGKSAKFPVMSAYPAGKFIQNEGSSLDEDTGLAGTSVIAETSLCGALIHISSEWLNDNEKDLSSQVFSAFEQGLNYRLDYACFQGNEADDADNGKFLGIISNSAVPVVNAAAGNTTVDLLGRDDLVRTIAAVNGGAIQRGAKWFANPSLVGALLKVKDDAGRSILRTVAEEDAAGELFTLAGFPLVLSGGLPETNAAGAKPLVFGHGPAYAVGVRRGLELMASAAGPSFSKNLTLVRALIRAGGKMRNAASFAVLKLAQA